MSCYYKYLPKLIPQLLLLSRPGSEIIVVSPWIQNVTLYPPIFGKGKNCYNHLQIRLSELLLRLMKDYQIHITLVLREQDRRSDFVIAPLLKNQPERLTLKEVQYIHAKMLITESFVLKTSANLIWTSLYRNVESCTLLKNLHRNPRKCLQAELGITI